MRFSNRGGFTLVELLIAVLLIDVALLALVAGCAIVVRRQVDLRSRVAAMQAASNRLQLLAAGTCQPTAGSAVGERGIVEFWSSAQSSAGQRELRDSVAFVVSGRATAVVLHARASC